MTIINPYSDSYITTKDGVATLIQGNTVTEDTAMGLTADITAIDQATKEVAYISQKTLFKNDGGIVTQIGSIKNIARTREDLDWTIPYTISGTTVQINVVGETGKVIDWSCRSYLTPSTLSTATGDNRTTGVDVKKIFETDLTADDVEEFITISNLLITEVLGSSSLSSDTLKEIERWVTAHMASAWDQRLKTEKIGDSAVSYQFFQGKGLKSTDYGQRALMLDTTGLLARVGGRTAKFFAAGVSID